MSKIFPGDFHIHTKHLKCANGTMEVPAILKEAERIGVKALAITDHLNTPDKLPLHQPIKDDIAALDTPIDVYFGVELNYMGLDGEFAYNEEIKEKMGFQFAIGGIHTTYLDTYDLKKIIDIQHRHHLKTCVNPLVDVLVHPYWFPKGEFERKNFPWFDSMKEIPEKYTRELGQVARETGTAIEINATANLDSPNHSEQYFKEYVDYLSILAEEGASFVTGSDAHDISRLKAVTIAWDVAEQLKIPPERIWTPKGKPMKAGR